MIESRDQQRRSQTMAIELSRGLRNVKAGLQLRRDQPSEKGK